MSPPSPAAQTSPLRILADYFENAISGGKGGGLAIPAGVGGWYLAIIGFHADCGIGHARSIERFTQTIGDLPVGHEIVLLSDHNHYINMNINPALDYYCSPARPAGTTGAPPTANHAPSNDGGRSSYASFLNKHALQGTFRHLHPNISASTLGTTLLTG